jgi:putative ABC transport system permease protein
MMSKLALWIALRLVSAVALLVPAARRGEWKSEWEGELRHYSARLVRRPNPSWSTHMSVVGRALGSLPDAAWIRRQFTFDADAVHDATHGVRMLLRTPGFTAIALLVFAIGIGATTAIVSLADALLMRPLPVPDAERVMTVWQHNRDTGLDKQDVAPANALDWMQRARSFEAVAMVEPWTFNSTIQGREPEYLEAARVGEQFFAVLGTRMLHGRAFLAHEFQKGTSRVVILSYGFWTTRLGGDVAVVGRPLRLDSGDPYTVVGVMPPSVELRLFNDRATRPEPRVWLPKQGLEPFEPDNRGQAYWNVIGRLRPDVSVDQAQAEIDTISAQLAREYPQSNARIAAQIVPLRVHLAGSLRQVLPLVLGAAVILLMVACTNVTNLLLARGVARGREFAVRRALGASRVRLVRQMLVETLVLAAAGGVAGLALTRWTLDVIARLRPMDAARIDRIPIDVRGAAIACGVTIVAAIIAGLTPSIQLSRSPTVGALKGWRTSSRRGAHGALVIVEVAAAVVLAVGAGLLVRSFLLIQRVDPGFSREQVTALQVFASPRLDTPQKRIVFVEQVLDRMRALPGVVAAGGVSAMPFGEAQVVARAPLSIAGRPVRSGDQPLIYTTTVAGDYFQAMGVPLFKGRVFDATDTATSPQVVLVSRNAAQRFWPGSDPIGSRVRFRFNAGTNYDAEVVGVVGDVLHETLDRPAPPELFIPYSQSGFRALTVVVRTAPESRVNLQMLKDQIWALDPLQSIFRTATLEEWISRTLVGRRFNLFLLGGFALATLLLASAGVYGVMNFSTSQRTREFGIRIALGAAGGDILRAVLVEGLMLAGVGVIVGIVAALALTRLLQGLLFGVTATDLMTFLIVGLGLLLVVTVACYVPARRALNIDPAQALRIE